MIYKFTPVELETLRNIGDTPDGQRFKEIMLRVKREISDVTNIRAGNDAEYAAQCIGIKGAVDFINSITAEMKRKEPRVGTIALDTDDEFS